MCKQQKINPFPLDTQIRTTLRLLPQAKEQHYVDRAFHTIGVMRAFLTGLAESPQLTEEQRAQVLAIEAVWSDVVFNQESEA